MYLNYHGTFLYRKTVGISQSTEIRKWTSRIARERRKGIGFHRPNAVWNILTHAHPANTFAINLMQIISLMVND